MKEGPSNMAQVNNSAQAQLNYQHQPQVPQENVTPQKTKNATYKLFIIVGAVLVSIVLLSTGYFLYISKQKYEASNMSATTISPTGIPTLIHESTLEAPQLYPEFEWEETSPTIPIDGPLLYGDDYEAIDISISGREWHSNMKNVNSFEELSTLRSGFKSYYGQEINRQGWDNVIEVNNKRIQVLAADSPAGGIIGYVKLAGNKMRLIMLKDNTKYRGRSTKNQLFSCPCDIELNVFVSDIFSTAELEN